MPVPKAGHNARGRRHQLPISPSVRSMLAVKRRETEAAAPPRLPKVTKTYKNTRAELQSIADPHGAGAYRFTDDVASILLKARYHGAGYGARCFQREFMSQLIYNNPHVRFGVHYLYPRSSRIRHNFANECKAHRYDGQASRLRASLASLDDERKARRERQAREMGLNEQEMENVEDVDSAAHDESKLAIQKALDKVLAMAARARDAVAAIEDIPLASAPRDHQLAAYDANARRTAALADAAILREQLGPDGRPTMTAEDRNTFVVGPTTPQTVIDAVRAGKAVDLSVEEALEVSYAPGGRPSDTHSLDVKASSDISALIERIGAMRLTAPPADRTLLETAAADSPVLLDA